MNRELEKLKKARDEALRAARDAVRDASRVNRILTVLNEPGPQEFLLENILMTISELFSADIVVLFDPVGCGNYYPIASIGLPEEFDVQSAPKGHIAPLFQQYRTSTILDKKVLEKHPVFGELSLAMGVESAAWIPMQGNRAGNGAVMLARLLPTPFTNKEMDLLSAMAYRIALTLEQIQSKRQLEYIVEGSQKIGLHLEKTTIENEAVQTFPDIVSADGAILINCRDNFEIVCANVSKTISLKDPLWSFLARSLSETKPVSNGNAVSMFLNSGEIAWPDDSTQLPYSAVLAAPVYRDGQLHSLLCAFRNTPVDFTTETRQIANLYSGQIAAALENAHLYGALRSELQERRAVEASLRESKERFEALIRNISDVIAVLNRDGTIRYVSEAAAKVLWRQTTGQLVGKHLIVRSHQDDCATLETALEEVLKKPGKNIRVVIRMREGEEESWRYFDVILTNLLHDRSVKGIVSTFHDVTDRKLFEKKLTQLALHDPLTGLSNRANFIEYTDYALKIAAEKGESLALIFFDLDNFKYVNDTFGHAAGDETLRTIAGRVQSCLRTVDLAARIGGDEFTILIENIQNNSSLQPLVDRILVALMEPIFFSGTEVHVGGSMGVARSVPDKDSAESLLHKADTAMYHAKRSGKGCCVFYDFSLEEGQSVS